MIRKVLPYSLNKRLFGDRRKYGIKCDYNDPDYKEWSKSYLQFYNDNQKGTIGHKVNHYGFQIVAGVDYKDKVLVELGPGLIEHIEYNGEQPDRYVLVDIDPQFLTASAKILTKAGYESVEELGIEPGSGHIPMEDNSVDVILTFHQLEHVYGLDDYLAELHRILKPGGLLVGAVPTDGSLAWGLGRVLTARRYAKKHMKFNYDKIICWEHPNFVDEIDRLLKKHFEPLKIRKRPFGFLPMDFNLSYSFIVRK